MTATSPAPLIDRRERLVWLGLYAAVLVSRMVLIAFPPALRFYNTDELSMVSSALDRFLGVPSVTLSWPGSTLQLLTTPVYGLWLADGCLHAGRNAMNLSCFASGLGKLYLNPWRALAVMRFMSAIIGSATPVLVALIVRRLGGSVVAALVAALSLATVGLLWQHEAMATPDAASITFALAALLVALTGPIVRRGRSSQACWSARRSPARSPFSALPAVPAWPSSYSRRGSRNAARRSQNGPSARPLGSSRSAPTSGSIRSASSRERSAT